MPDRASSGPARRVVLLTPRPGDPADLSRSLAPRPVEVIGTDSGYEAAAELLMAPVDALLADLALVGTRHQPLLRLAVDKDVAVFAFGCPASTFDPHCLPGVEVCEHAELPGRLSETFDRLAPPSDSATEDPPPAPPAAEPAPPPPAEGTYRAESAFVPAEAHQPGRPGNPTPPPAAESSPRSVLSPEELAALLERRT